jgi:hypothetical protein
MKELKRGAKTESLSLRIDPKTKFVLEFMVRVKGFRVTDLIEQAIKSYAEQTTVGGDFNGDGAKSWMYYWHPEEGVRIINMITDRNLNTSFEEDEIVDFINQHEEFFFDGSTNNRKPLPVFIQTLWPKISEYLDHWRENKSTDRWATGKLMLEAIKTAGMRGPDWPRMTKTTPPAPKPRGPAKPELDDEIPF